MSEYDDTGEYEPESERPTFTENDVNRIVDMKVKETWERAAKYIEDAANDLRLGSGLRAWGNSVARGLRLHAADGRRQ